MKILQNKLIKRSFSYLFLFLIFIPNLLVNAETTNDLRAVYDCELKKGLRELQQKYIQAVDNYQNISKEVAVQEKFNGFLEDAKLYWNTQCAMIDMQIEEILFKNQAIIKEISDKFFEDFEDLAALDAAYKSNTESVDNLLHERNSVVLVDGYTIDYNTLDELSKEIEDMKEDYEESIKAAELGEVTNVKFPLGAESKISSKFGERLDPLNPTTIRFHAGLDLKASMNTPVLSIFNGTVSATGWGPLGGYYVRVDHGDGIGSYYCHLNEITCETGQKVSQYEQIALSGNTGSRTTGPHLHFSLYIDGTTVDPAILFNKE